MYLSNLEYEAKEYVLNRALERNGYSILILNSFQDIMSNWANKKEYENIERTFDKLQKYYSPSNRRKKDTERKYWLIFFMIESLIKEKDCKR